LNAAYPDAESGTRYYVLSLEIERDTDGARDLVYFSGADVASVIVYDVDDMLEQLK
jgi:hypothetical protein